MKQNSILAKIYISLFHVYQVVRLTVLRLLLAPFGTIFHRPVDFTDRKSSGILITGTSTGIGRDAVLRLLDRDYTVFATVRSEQDAKNLKKDASMLSGNLITLIMDVSEMPSIRNARRSVEKWIADAPDRRKLVAVVNNAGIAECLPMELEPMQNIEAILDTNVAGTIRVSKVFVPLLRNAKGRLVVIGSSNGSIGVPLMSTYSATKFALEGWCDAVRIELFPSDVHVCLVRPGAVKTPAFSKINDYAKESLDMLTDTEKIVGTKFYSHLLGFFETIIEGINGRGVDPFLVYLTILDTIESPYPQSRYTVGLDALLITNFSKFVPDLAVDFLLMSVLYLQYYSQVVAQKFGFGK